ncbi:hypothetical protein RUM44_005217 [Polyplax serrata]|uniref:DUF4485 domain-containing protein n=1 Tax=Polyplax serrata TaxID=468196 RepID=A0ABR1AEF3_POLSC
MCDNDLEEFKCHSLIIQALLHYLPYLERQKARDWLTKLQKDDCQVDTKIRNEYAFYLLLNVQNGTMSQPFNKAPPLGKLKPLCRTLPEFLYEDVMKQLKESYPRLVKMLEDTTEQTIPDLACEPENFHNQQPRPRKGVSAHFAVFSNFDGDNNFCN